VNAVYFRGAWFEQFDPNLTQVKPFFLGSKKSKVDVTRGCPLKKFFVHPKNSMPKFRKIPKIPKNSKNSKILKIPKIPKIPEKFQNLGTNS